MDAYLSREVRQSFSALNLLSSNPDGFLFGHKRGNRFFVEKILPTMKGFFPSLQKYQEFEELYEENLLGFFSFRADEKKISKLLAPYAFGKLFIEICLSPQKKITVKPYVIDFDKVFLLSPIKLKSLK